MQDTPVSIIYSYMDWHRRHTSEADGLNSEEEAAKAAIFAQIYNKGNDG